MKIRHVSWLLLCFALLNLGCQGEDGARGPAGPAGTANVIYSDWYSPDAWTVATLFGIHERSYTMTTSSLTQEIIDHGVVMVYMRFLGLSPEINQLPIELADVHLSFFVRAQAGSIKVVYYSLTSPTTDPVVIPSSNTVRYVLIPGGVLGDAALSRGITREQIGRFFELHALLRGVPPVRHLRVTRPASSRRLRARGCARHPRARCQ